MPWQYPQKAASGGPPSGAAGGDLGGTYPNPDVEAIDGVVLSGTPSAGQVLTATGAAAAHWAAGGAFNGGTITNPLVVDSNSANPAIDVERQATSNGLGLFIESDAQNDDHAGLVIGLTPGAEGLDGSITAYNGNLNIKALTGGPDALDVSGASGATALTIDATGKIGFFGGNSVAQQSLDPGTATPAQIAAALITSTLMKHS